MKAMILSAGFGQRFLPLTSILPKPLIPYFNKAIIENTLLFLKQNNIHQVVINIHHLSDLIKNHLKDGRKYDIEIIYSEEKEILGTAGGIKAAEKHLSSAPFLVINSDILFNLDLGAFLSSHNKSKATITMLLRCDPHAKKYGLIKVDEKGRVVNFLDHTLSTLDAQNLNLTETMYTGIQLIDPSVFGYIPKNRYCDLSQDIYPSILKSKGLYGVVSEQYWIDVGKHKSYLKAHADAIKGHYNPPSGEDFKTTGRRFSKDCQINPSSVIGPYTIIGKGACIDNSVVKRSILWENASLKNCQISGCIIGPNVTLKDRNISDKVIINDFGKITISPLS